MKPLRLSLVPTALALIMVLTLAGSVAAATASATTVADTCTLAGGKWGNGYAALKVRATEIGLAGATSIRFVASLMHQPRASSTIWTLHQTQQRVRYFPDTAAANSRTWTAVWYFGGDTVDYRHRIEVSVWFLNSAGGVLATRGVVGTSC